MTPIYIPEYSSIEQSVSPFVKLKLSSRPYGQYANVINNPTLKKLFIENTMSLGLDGMVDERTMIPRGSTDMGNVSYEVPSIHPMFAIETKRGNHTKEFTVATGQSFIFWLQSFICDVFHIRSRQTLK